MSLYVVRGRRFERVATAPKVDVDDDDWRTPKPYVNRLCESPVRARLPVGW